MVTKLFVMSEFAELPRRDLRKKWLHLQPDLVEALEGLADRDGCNLEQLLISLINEALAHRLRRG